MKNCLLWLVICLTVAWLPACRETDRQSAVISGKLEGLPGFKLVIGEMEPRHFRPVDSLVTGPDGRFSCRVTTGQPGFWYVQSSSGKILVTELHPGDHLILEGSAPDFPDQVLVTGSERAERLNDFFRFTRTQERTADSLEMILGEFQDSAVFAELTQEFDTVFKTIWERQREEEISYIRGNSSALSSLIVLNYAFGLSPVLDIRHDYAIYRLLDSTLSIAYPGNPHVIYHHKRMDEYRSTGE